jgi:hypothetical protein
MEAITYAEQLWAKEKRTAVAPAIAVSAWQFKSFSGPARSTLATLRQYGLLDKTSDGVRLSKLAMEIIHQPPESDERVEAIRAAAMKPTLFRDLAKTHGEASDDALRAYLITRKSFSEDGAKRVIRAFRQSMTLANLPGPGYFDTEMRAKEAEQPDPTNGVDLIGGLGQVFKKPKVTLFNWKLAKDQNVEVRFIGQDIETSHIELLKQYLDLTKQAIASEAEPKGVPTPT